MAGGPSGDVIQSIELFNYDTGKYKLLDTRAVATTDEIVQVTVPSNFARFVQPGTNEITANVEWIIDSFSGSPFTWSIDSTKPCG